MYWGLSGARVEATGELATPRGGREGQHLGEEACEGMKGRKSHVQFKVWGNGLPPKALSVQVTFAEECGAGETLGTPGEAWLVVLDCLTIV